MTVSVFTSMTEIDPEARLATTIFPRAKAGDTVVTAIAR
jgi:hypothetical protein